MQAPFLHRFCKQAPVASEQGSGYNKQPEPSSLQSVASQA